MQVNTRKILHDLHELNISEVSIICFIAVLQFPRNLFLSQHQGDLQLFS